MGGNYFDKCFARHDDPSVHSAAAAWSPFGKYYLLVLTSRHLHLNRATSDNEFRKQERKKEREMGEVKEG